MKKILYISVQYDEYLMKLVEEFVKHNDEERYAYSNSFVTLEDRFNRMIVYLMLHYYYRDGVLRIFYGKNGKPYLSKKGCTHSISIAHTKNIVVIAISDTDIGIDVECISCEFFDVSRFICNDCEKEQIGDSLKTATIFWVVKEALSKLKNEDWYSQPKTDLIYDSNYIIDNKNRDVFLELYQQNDVIICTASFTNERGEVTIISSDDIRNFLETK
ncbi:hypothetical protein NHG25_06630 [Aerococcaceae bacterium NML191292]|nr:hypothetical protein [Aerococcaceae bacterium NML191292]